MHKDIYNDACPNLVVALSDFKQGGHLARGSHRARAAVCPGGLAMLAVSELMAPLSFHRDRLALASRPKKKIIFVEILQFSFMTC